MKKATYLLYSTSIGLAFFGIVFTAIRTFYYGSFPSTQEYIFPFLMGTTFGTGIGLWRLQTDEYKNKLEQMMTELRNYNSQLQIKNEKLKETQIKLRHAEKMETIGLLAGGVAHDLNNILSSIVNYPELMLLGLPDDSPLNKPLHTIKNSGQKAAAIIQDLLSLARRGVQNKQVINLKQTIEQYLSAPECERLRSFHPNVVIETEFAEGVLPIKGSSLHLYKTVMNLVSNAAEAMPDGGTIQISLESRYIDCPMGTCDQMAKGDYTILTVSDTGIGLAEEDLERIFEPFFTKKKMGRSGTGLGMAVVWGTVRDHDGYIDVQSKIEEGSRFTIYYPATIGTCDTDKKESLEYECWLGKGELVLIVDDVAVQREIATEVVEKLNYKVASVPSGEAAIEYLKDKSVDIMILDMIMEPGIDGLETYKRAIQCRPGIKAVIASGYSESERVREAQRLGAGEYLPKPYTMQYIAEVLNRELGRSSNNTA